MEAIRCGWIVGGSHWICCGCCKLSIVLDVTCTETEINPSTQLKGTNAIQGKHHYRKYHSKGETNLQYLSRMRTPGITQIPTTVLVSIIHFYLAIDRAGREAIAVGVEGCRLHHVFVAVLEEGEAILCAVCWVGV